MKIIMLLFLSLFSVAAYSDESLVINLSGSYVQGSGTVANSSYQFDGVESTWQEHYTGDFLYKNLRGSTTHTNANLGVKLDYKLADRYYLQAGIRGEYDNLRKGSYSTTTELGVGYKFIHTSTVKLSDEIGLGIRNDQFNSSPILSNSIWFTWKITDRLTFVNKFLIERGWEKSYLKKDYYTSNLTALTYKLAPRLDLSIQQKYKKEERSNTNVTLFGLALRF